MKQMMIKVGMRVGKMNTTAPLMFDLRQLPMVLIVGASGSGKSYLLKFIFASLLKYQAIMEIFCLDFKNSGDYEFMDAEHLSVGKDCVEMLDKVYKRYKQIKEDNMSNIVLCVFDEYAAFITWLNSYDKKLGKKAMDQVQEILMMGRRINKNNGGAYMITVLQRPDSAYFGTARDNYFVKIIMKDVTRSIRTMLEIDEKDIPEEHKARTGHGIMIVDENIYAFIVPTYDETLMNAMLTAKRSEAVSIAEVVPNT